MHYPLCQDCLEPLTENERDHDPEGRGSFYSSHFGCSSQAREGRYEVRAYLDGERYGSQGSRWRTWRRAIRQARYLARSNTGRWVFAVVDRGEGQCRGTAPTRNQLAELGIVRGRLRGAAAGEPLPPEADRLGLDRLGYDLREPGPAADLAVPPPGR